MSLRVRSVGDDALLVEVASGAEAEALHAELLRRRAAGLLSAREIVPAARTVLLDGLTDPGRLASELAASDIPPAPARESDVVEIPTRYDGPDLSEVAALWGVPEQEVARIHAAAVFRVAFCGFAPGFGYLTGLPARYDVPRRAAPRTSVPHGFGGAGGAVHGRVPAFLAGRLAVDRHHGGGAVGPRARTGRTAGAGHTRALRPGGAGRAGGHGGDGRDGGDDMSDRALCVVRAGALTTVQDRGRPGHAHLGVPRSGALDVPAAALVNRLVGNPPDAAVLETTLNGCALRPRSAVTVAVGGAPCRVTVDGRSPGAHPCASPPGRCWTSDRPSPGYAVTWQWPHGIAVEPVLGSRSTDLLSGLGPAPLTDGTILPLGPLGPPGRELAPHARVDVAPQLLRPRPNSSCG